MKRLVSLITILLISCQVKDKYGKEIPQDLSPIKIREILNSPTSYQNKEVLVIGKITAECGSGCWFFIQDETGQIYVDLAPSKFAIPQRIGKEVIVYGKVEIKHGEPMIIGKGVKFK
ncbi:MAG: hypothetical protein N2323_01255 [candidate division WOR-3 bacterium]|nr:hypothetical protein [candidate division WOR-3 bacterium]MCX7836574.1 hypothetical protein [candidate division WOR-3 bacterium]MDW8114174.1 hypothetical protein [candidate division WOR-3 bacterium]